MVEITTQKNGGSLQERLISVAEDLREAVNAVIQEVPVAVKKPSEFRRVLKLDPTLSSRLLRAVRLADPLATLFRMPGLNGIRQLLSAAAVVHVDPVLIERANQALSTLEHVVATEVGTWQELNAAITGWLPDARLEFELANRQTAFRAMSNLKGVAADVDFSVALIHPSREDPDWADRAAVAGMVRMKRLRPGTPISFLHGCSVAPPVWSQHYALDGRPVDPEHPVPIIPEFSSRPTPEFEVRPGGTVFHYLLKGDRVGVGSLVDLCFGDITPRRYPTRKGVDDRPAMPGYVLDLPVKMVLFDVLVHEDLWPGVKPELRMYDTTGRGVVDACDPERDIDRVETAGPMQEMGALERLRVAEVAHYVDMVQHVCNRLGWDSSRFRAFRYRIDYPVYGTQVSAIFNPPE